MDKVRGENRYKPSFKSLQLERMAIMMDIDYSVYSYDSDEYVGIEAMKNDPITRNSFGACVVFSIIPVFGALANLSLSLLYSYRLFMSSKGGFITSIKILGLQILSMILGCIPILGTLYYGLFNPNIRCLKLSMGMKAKVDDLDMLYSLASRFRRSSLAFNNTESCHQIKHGNSRHLRKSKSNHDLAKKFINAECLDLNGFDYSSIQIEKTDLPPTSQSPIVETLNKNIFHCGTLLDDYNDIPISPIDIRRIPSEKYSSFCTPCPKKNCLAPKTENVSTLIPENFILKEKFPPKISNSLDIFANENNFWYGSSESLDVNVSKPKRTFKKSRIMSLITHQLVSEEPFYINNSSILE
ncbi:hypothetical protein AYI68_g1010 [Smittium mucronatum]|uniref:Uncharacterized protein n=1 Tax=Smittium mucronatum TaxID=133383 RepID=A0A1R0H6V8_9FUNG|nr:hypothetical protein AYI68_g1010 [Smittium mucronatum]